MRSLPLPCDERGIQFIAKEVYALCISRIRVAKLKAKLAAIANEIAEAAKDYDVAAAGNSLHTFPRRDSVGRVSCDELVSVYVYRMVPASQPGRGVYDRLMSAPQFGRCPLCDVGTVNTLDHHLPKSSYPILVVTPNNLIPCCQWCQGKKREVYPLSQATETVHPYFDDFDSDVWLCADVVQSKPASFRLYAKSPAAWGPLAESRLSHHLETFQLAELFALNAGSELAGIRSRLKGLFNAGSEQAVREHLQEEASSREASVRNSWRGAMYRAGASSSWFCSGGFAGE